MAMNKKELSAEERKRRADQAAERARLSARPPEQKFNEDVSSYVTQVLSKIDKVSDKIKASRYDYSEIELHVVIEAIRDHVTEVKKDLSRKFEKPQEKTAEEDTGFTVEKALKAEAERKKKAAKRKAKRESKKSK